MEDLSKVAPKLSKTSRELPFKVPHNYFDDFNARLMTKIGEEESGQKQGATFIRVLKPALSLVASFAIIFMLVYWPLSKFNSNQVAETNSTTVEHSLENEYIGMLEEMDDNTLLAILENGFSDDQISDDELVSYLSDNLSEYDICVESK